MRLAVAMLGVIGAAMQFGCATRALWEWQDDEVSVEFHALRVKNVPTVPDGEYSIVAPPDWSGARVDAGIDGTLEYSPAAPLSLEPRMAKGALQIRAMDLSEARLPYLGNVGEDVVACVEPMPERNYRVHVLQGDAARHRWVRLGTLDVGPGTQSESRGFVAVIATPFTVVADIVSLPFLIVGAVAMGAAMGIGELTGG